MNPLTLLAASGLVAGIFCAIFAFIALAFLSRKREDAAYAAAVAAVIALACSIVVFEETFKRYDSQHPAIVQNKP